MKFDFLSESDQAYFIHKASTLVEALPYIREHAGNTIVIKYGGHALGNSELSQSFSKDIGLIKEVGILPVIVHGGGPQIGALLKEKNIQDYFGNVILVNFWATWCSPCLKEIPDLNRLQTEFKDKGFVLISLSDEPRKTLIDFMSQNLLVTISGYVENYQWIDVNLGSVRPVTFLIDKKGKILEYYTGAYNFDFYKKRIVPLL